MSNSISPADAALLIRNGATLVDIRETDEYRREHIDGAVNCPVSVLDTVAIEGDSIVFHCKSGRRTLVNADRLAAKAGERRWLLLDGGLDKWKQSGLPVRKDASQPIELQRQVMIGAGTLVLGGVLLASFVASPFILLSGFVGVGLVFAGVTGFCGMAKVLMLAPWNRR
ncbi:rhodanese family protein [Asticcacaulis tiandongensis]|uniref:rhodanese family protein n=1 Tax=Asticcacaulis tiandongensis TaxID=2565365 RepID=UPI00112E786A|nr:rhodanese family protein [Asticcacaulis tiandongensis]